MRNSLLDVKLGGSDYQHPGDQSFTFDASRTSYTFNISLVNDDVFEVAEHFQAGLRFPGAAPLRVSLQPAQAEIEIIDDDGKGSIP